MFSKKSIFSIVFSIILLFLFLFPFFTFAIDTPMVPDVPIIGKADIFTIVSRIINIALSLLGVIAIGLIVWAGYLWMTAAGNKDTIDKAKKVLTGAIIGLIIIFSSWAIATFIIKSLTEATNPSGPSEPSRPPLPDREFYITSVVPRDGMTGVFKNTLVIANFNKYLKLESVTSSSVIVKKTLNNEIVRGTLSVRNNSLTFIPEAPCLGQPSCHCFESNTQYTITIKSGSIGVKSYEDEALNSDKIWSFTTSDLIDLEKPKVEARMPESPPDAPRNTLIQVVFTKDINPLTIGTSTVKIFQGANEIEGKFETSNDSFSFSPNTVCPSPNQDLKCFDPKIDISVTLLENIQDYTGCNNLICTNGKCSWTFHTSDQVDFEPPIILENSLVPQKNETGTDRATNISAKFNKSMNRNLINSSTIVLEDASGNKIASSVNLNNDFQTFVLDPTGILEPDLVHVTFVYGGANGVKATNGKVMDNDFSWGFVTGKQAYQGLPHIESIDPISGPERTCFTLNGINFKTSGDLKIKKKTGEFVSVSEIGTWQDKFITSSILSILGFNPNEKTKIKAIVENKESNEIEFTLTNSELGACLLKMNPLTGPWQTAVSLEGRRFGSSKGASDGTIFYQTPATNFTSWADNKIETKVPDQADDGNVTVVKNGKSSNGIPFDVKCNNNSQCQNGESCCSDNQCRLNCSVINCLSNSGCGSQCCLNNKCQTSADECSISCQTNPCSTDLQCCSDKICRTRCNGETCQKNLDCNSNLVSVPGTTWEGGFEENIANWGMGGQKHSWVKIETADAFGGGKAIHIHQDPNQSYPGICDEATCKDMSWCTWLSRTNQCKFNDGDQCKGWTGPVYYNQGETLCWGNTHRVMWLYLTYNTTPLKLVPGKTYTYSFYYKGQSAGGLNMYLTYSIGWTTQCVDENYYNGIYCNAPYGKCSEQPGYCCMNVPYQKKCYPSIYLDSVPVGNYSDWKKFTKSFIYTKEMSETFDKNGALHNEIGMQIGYNTTGSLGTDLFIDNVQLEQGGLSSDLTCCRNTCQAIPQCRVYLPVIDSISPFDGRVNDPVTTYVTIRGKNFGQTQGSSKVYFGDKEASSVCQNWSDTEIVVSAPFNISGTTPIKIVTNQGESNKKDFTVNNIIKPSICNLSPNHGKTGDKITISGTNFGDSQNNGTYKSQVFFNNLEANVNSWSNGNIEITVPNGITVSEPKVKVVLNWTGNSTNSNEVSFYMNPFITSITPDKGPKDSYVTIRGGNFGNNPGKIFFNGVQASLAPCKDTAWSDKEIIALAPNSTNGSVIVETNTNIRSNNDKAFTYNTDPLAPGICLDKAKAWPGDPVTITGNKFGETATTSEGVTFNQVKAEVSLANPDDWTNYQINTKVPQTSSGDVLVTKIGQRDTGRKECINGIYILGICVGGEPKPIMEQVVLNSNPVYFEVKQITHRECSAEGKCIDVAGLGVNECVNDLECNLQAECGAENIWSYTNPKYNFIIQYCKKEKEALIQTKVSDEEYFFQGAEKNNVVGFKIEKNEKFYSPQMWYKWKFPESKAGLQLMEIDGYQAVQDGNTIYVGATNIEGNNIVPYIFILSRNDRANESVNKIFEEMLRNWKFNINL